jgi:hypothetical protein
MNLNSVIQLDL